MHPEVGKGFSGCCFGLGDLIFMVREAQIGTAAMNIKGITEAASRHGGAFDMPAGSAITPGGGPAGFTGFCGFPQDKIEGAAFLCFDFDARA